MTGGPLWRPWPRPWQSHLLSLPVSTRCTDRDREVLDLLVQGLTNKQIADRLFISPNTVKRHLKAVFAKLEVNTRAAAVAKAMGE